MKFENMYTKYQQIINTNSVFIYRKYNHKNKNTIINYFHLFSPWKI